MAGIFTIYRRLQWETGTVLKRGKNGYASSGYCNRRGGWDLLCRGDDFPPAGPDVDKLDLNTMMNAVGADAPKRGLPPSNPLVHRTRTVDYAIIMTGEIDMMLDTGAVHLKPGDGVVQQSRAASPSY